ncbi:uncharacterized protein K460DRAFT_367899 [Cucurbitaria berberidis CBS 394.84]|uniref:Uncharacterized protein n=1 Tax=Cucurbitaria berberidis CBS 394.84 TaxID=1168544 RepID=A0A9P4GD25_9PLEO|nr:uncharacterized protein K460DRAFT_367899 [Cucurbitaria berberidis CBS 394.84]KAF1842980.1 hypothetical protein K460DRAFT_367899 [Cucurbitaria berberidis CBS 394.84]
MSLPQAPTENTMSHVIIPAAVEPSGPQFQRFPNELLLEIIKYSVALSPDSKLGNVVDKKYFYFLNSLGPFFKLRKVSKLFASLATRAFYEVNYFKFVSINAKPGQKALDTTIPMLLPPIHVRGYLRRIHLAICLADFFTTTNRGDEVPQAQRWCAQHRITTIQDLFAHCYGARHLRALSDHTLASGRLSEVNLHILTDFRFLDAANFKATMALFTEALFVVTAGKVQITVTNEWGLSEAWHTELVKTIGVKEQ